ncbi:MurNAc alpha-1-phosphate uridylyltransferase [Mariprofundus ferrinatatus]|uniref:MurNAc alpha-1-phosphate uridylyltransferase n=1 Tax=Mariprofundus ferrinatatus TaxID=1921087 RepID=A0A2K8L1S0_9PROT|nr:nucleotidyltransferase family protein [Mariprofundus ferrinatatus]ATX81265.1 MurNAc alpha-1-phosphate uridylyltransferase [Mariprofundus ferrinatatus]
MSVDRAVVLAAGLGTRLKWLTDSRPKALMHVAGEPVIGHLIRSLVSQGISDIAVNAHHHAHALKTYLGDGSRFGCRIRISYEPVLLDSGGGVKQALDFLPGSGPVAVCNADVLSDFDIGRLANVIPDSGAAIGLVENARHHPGGDFALDGSSVLADGDSKLTFSGISLWQERLFDGYEEGAIFSLVEPMRKLIATGRCAGVRHNGYWFDIGRPSDLMRANRLFGR